MRRAAAEEAERRYGTQAPVYDYRWEHVQAVRALALKLARLTGADPEVVEAAAWLHDVRKGAGENHAQEGADYARSFLPQTDFPAEKIERVARAIEEHVGLWLDEPLQHLESQVLWDADKLTKLGLTAAVQWTGMTFANGEPTSTADLIAKGRDVDWQQKTVDSMHTAPARRAAEARLKTFNDLWNALEAELEGKDLGETHG
jgi:uncharacterized protein